MMKELMGGQSWRQMCPKTHKRIGKALLVEIIRLLRNFNFDVGYRCKCKFVSWDNCSPWLESLKIWNRNKNVLGNLLNY